MNNATIKVTHIGEDYSYINLHITTAQVGQTIEDIEVSRRIGEILETNGFTEGDEFND